MTMPASTPANAQEEGLKAKPCPFCGERPLRPAQNLNTGAWWISCTNCDAEMSHGSASLVLAAWNRRAAEGEADAKNELTWDLIRQAINAALDTGYVTKAEHGQMLSIWGGLLEASDKAKIVLDGWRAHELDMTNREYCEGHPWYASAGVASYELGAARPLAHPAPSVPAASAALAPEVEAEDRRALHTLQAALDAYRATLANWNTSGDTYTERRYSEGERYDTARERLYEELTQLTPNQIDALVASHTAQAERIRELEGELDEACKEVTQSWADFETACTQRDAWREQAELAERDRDDFKAQFANAYSYGVDLNEAYIALTGQRDALKTALGDLIGWIVAGQEHGDGADDDDICASIKRAPSALASLTQKGTDYAD
jgi:hypothetical protein